MMDLKALRKIARQSPVGKHTGNALYVHRSAISGLPTELQFHIAHVTRYDPPRPPWNVVKISFVKPTVSLLWYPQFSLIDHPVLVHSVVHDLVTGKTRFLVQGLHNPPILHRKEEMVSLSHQDRVRWTNLTLEEERMGYYEQPSRIGRYEGWQGAKLNADVKRLMRKVDHG
jgi:DNA phosphorothioation-associated putative methyltransferase